ncbi:DUF3280 domain-containing protein [Paracoccus sp. TK19116]|uniref:DUF3280 domain-containing protein n=1 Tax=Paracoccus albicereus TaxID=2922394 RepID=A0ABT1MP40_9RHOB|nr:DUF2380 domain-containing protein [Paracoccus albicereus]MCQ0970057.1 DUF3280 domain-containing protein [Paracoccus albicereus]
MRHILTGALTALILASSGASAAETLAVFPVKLLDTSNEARDQRADHASRQTMMAEILAEGLPGEKTMIAPETVAQVCPQATPDCLFGVARDAGADQALFVSLQKASSLIITMYVSIVELDDGALVKYGDLSFRGDTDQSWQRAAEYVVKEMAAGAFDRATPK